MAFLLVTVGVVDTGRALTVTDQVKINEVSYDPSETVLGSEEPYEYIELYNAGGTTAFLDGAVISDEGGNGTAEATFTFPGPVGGTTIPLAAGAYMLLVTDATGSPWGSAGVGGNGLARYEFFGGGTDLDDPDTPNLIKTAGTAVDFLLANSGDGITLSTGVSTGSAIPCPEVVDGVSWELGGGTDINPLSNFICSDAGPHPGYIEGGSSGIGTLQRVPNGFDTNTSSSNDFQTQARTPGFANILANYVGVFADSLATATPLCAPAGVPQRAYVVAILGGPSATGIRGAEFRIEVANPSGYFFSFQPAVGVAALGDAMDLSPADPTNTAGTTITFSGCRPSPPGEGARVVLGTIDILNLTGQPTDLRVRPKTPPTVPAEPCAAFTRCDFPLLTRICMTPLGSADVVFETTLQGSGCVQPLLPPPVGLAVQPTGPANQHIGLSWQPPAVGQPIGYRVFRSTNGSPEAPLSAGLINATTFVDTLPPAGLLCYTVAALAAGSIEGEHTQPVCIQFTPVFEPETVLLDLHEPGDDGIAGPVATTQVMVADRDYLVTVEGTFSRWPVNAWASPPNTLCGYPERQPQYPSPGMPSDLVGDDADIRFAAPVPPAGDCNALESGGLPRHTRRLEFDAGSGFVHPEPRGGAPGDPPPAHRYSYTLHGENHPLRVRYLDATTSDNYGALRVTVEEIVLSAADGTPTRSPSTAALRAFPNPFNPSVRIEYSGPSVGSTTIAIVDVAGRQRRLLRNGQTENGATVFMWDGSCDDGTAAASGVYWARATGGSGEASRRIVLTR